MLYLKPFCSSQGWLSRNSYIERSETGFIENYDVLLSLCPREDGIVACQERKICAKIVRRFSKVRRLHIGCSRLTRPQNSDSISNDPHVQILSRSSTIRVARAILSPLIVFLLLAPAMICNMIDSQPARLAIMRISTAVFVFCMFLLANAKTVELVVAAAT